MDIDTFIKWTITTGAYSAVAVFFGGIAYLMIIRPILLKWIDYKRKRDARDLSSYTVLVKEANMRSTAIESVLKLFNDEIIKKKRVELDEILSVTYSPHAIGHQFTLWYKEGRYTTTWWADFIGELFSGLGNHNYYNDNKGYYKNDIRLPGGKTNNFDL